MTTRLFSALVVVVSFALLGAEVNAAGSTSSSTRPSPTVSKPSPSLVETNYAKGVAAIDKRDWNLAIFYFSKVAEADLKNADAQNWLGYSYRKLKDFDNAFAHYRQALAIDPNHKGAHEYIGEAYLETGNLAQAEQHLATLAKLCSAGCKELDDLRVAVAKFKTRG